MHSSIAYKYVASLSQLDTNLEDIYKEISMLMEAINRDAKLKKMLFAKMYPYKKKLKYCNKLLELCKVSKITFNFINVLLKNNRLHLMDAINAELKSMTGNSQTVTVISTQKITSKQKEDIINCCFSLLNDKNLNFKFETNKRILGGLMLKIGYYVLDLSLRKKVFGLKKAFSLENLNI